MEIILLRNWKTNLKLVIILQNGVSLETDICKASVSQNIFVSITKATFFMLECKRGILMFVTFVCEICNFFNKKFRQKE